MKDKFLKIDATTAGIATIYLLAVCRAMKPASMTNWIVGLIAAFILGGSITLILIDRLRAKSSDTADKMDFRSGPVRTYGALLFIAVLCLVLFSAGYTLIEGMPK